MDWVIQALNGISFGALLFLLASGFTVTFGLMRVVNLAHGSFYLVGGYVGYSVSRATGSFWLGLLAGGLGIALLGLLMERFLTRKVLGNDLAQVLLTIGVSYILTDVGLAIWGGIPLRVQPPDWATGAATILGVTYPRFRFYLILLGLIVAALLWLALERTQIGAIVRASVEDREMAGALGINVSHLFVIIFTVGASLAGLAGVIGGSFLTLYPLADWEILAFALVVVIVGGLGSLQGAIVGSLLVGLVDAFGRWLVPELSYFMIFAPMAVLLAVRPTGLFGKEA